MISNHNFEMSVLDFYISMYQSASSAIKAEVDSIVSIDLFVDSNHRMLWGEIEKRRESGGLDMISIDSALENESWYIKAGGWGFLGDITASNMRQESVPDHAKQLDELRRQRDSFNILNSALKTIQGKGDHNEKMTVVSDAISSVSSLMTSTKKEKKTIATAIDKILNYIEEKNNSDESGGLRTNIAAIDNAMGVRGIGKTDFIVIGARPKTGKTLTSLRITSEVAAQGKNVLFFSLEMSDFELGIRLLANQSLLNPSDFYGDTSDENHEFWAGMQAASSKLYKQGIFIEDTPALKIQQMVAIAKQINAKNGLDLIVVDYLQKAGVNEKGRHDLAVGEISGGLKNLAKEIETPVIALSQLNRNGVGKPTIAHLRESGQIEQDADAIFLMHNLSEGENGEPTNPIVEINMPAYRHGQSAEPAYLDKAHGKIKDADMEKVAMIKHEQDLNSKPSRPQGFQPKGFIPQ
tara:strand:- start:16581 stop:17975 length:1395 start_codon:yes stop_codon:yes gene_type:complete